MYTNTYSFQNLQRLNKTFLISLSREHLKARRELVKNNAVIITRPDKGRATVILTREKYLFKMAVILDDTSKFSKLSPVATHDNTVKVEKNLVTYLKLLKAEKEIINGEFLKIKPMGSIRPRLSGLPKIHNNCPLRPILSMVSSPQYSISKWLRVILGIVQSYYCTHTVKDSCQFVDILRSHQVPASAHMCSFDVVSLFTNVPLDETIDICTDVLYRNDSVDTPWLSETAFRKLMSLVTTGMEFSFNDIMYRQVDGVAMGSPLGPVLANIFVGYSESLINESMWPQVYVRFVDDSFTYFDSVEQCDTFFHHLNNLHPVPKYTCEHEHDNKLSFLDVQVEKSNNSVVTSVCRKPTFTGQCIVYNSYCSHQYKVNLVRNLVGRAKRLCSETKLNDELEFLRSIFLKNGYPHDLLNKILKQESNNKDIFTGPRKCPIYLCLPWKGNASVSMSRAIKTLVNKTYFAAHFITTVRAFMVRKDVQPPQLSSHLVYLFECRNCAARYVGRTLQRLNARIRQHVPLHLLSPAARAKRPKRGRPCKNPVSSVDKHAVPTVPPVPVPPPAPPPAMPWVAGAGVGLPSVTWSPLLDPRRTAAEPTLAQHHRPGMEERPPRDTEPSPRQLPLPPPEPPLYHVYLW